MEKLSYKLPVFEGPLDLLLHLISKNKLNIYDIPVAELLDQYLEHIERMRQADMDVASEFITVASRLIYIKTVMLMPHNEEADELKRELTGQLIEYRLCRVMAARLGARANFDQFSRDEATVEFDNAYRLSHEAEMLLAAYLAAVGRGMRLKPPPQAAFTSIIATPVVSVTSRVIYILRKLYKTPRCTLSALFSEAKTKSEAVATFLALLDLLKAERVELRGDGEIMFSEKSRKRK